MDGLRDVQRREVADGRGGRSRVVTVDELLPRLK